MATNNHQNRIGRTTWCLVGIFVAVVLACATSARLQAEAPPQGLSLPVTVLRNHDGDTATVEIKLVVNVRLIGEGHQCWAPELNQPGGKQSQRSLEAASKGKHGTLLIPIKDATNLSHLLTLGRVLGNIWIDGEEESLSEMQIRTKNASTKKGGTLGE